MKNGRKIWLCLVLLLAASGMLRAQGDTVHNYRFATDVDSTQWIILDSPDSLPARGMAVTRTLPFTFYFCARPSTQITIGNNGIITLLSSSNQQLRPVANLVQTSAYAPAGTSLLEQTVVDSATGGRVYVLQFHYPLVGQQTLRDWQVQLHEADHSVTFVYRPYHDALSVSDYTFGMTDEDEHHIYDFCINTDSHTATTVDPVRCGWPDAWRYYRFTPLSQCFEPITYSVTRMSGDHAELSWTTFGRSNRFLVRYSTWDNGVELADSFVVNDTSVTIPILPDHCYYAYVYTLCSDGDTSMSGMIHFDTPCIPEGNQIDYADIYAANVTCRYGTFNNPSVSMGMVNHGSSSMYSRHTVQYDRDEMDSRTNFLLHTVPPNHCTSVRLGNWMSGAEQEEIDYALRIDTNNYDLLILRYALVEQDPSHQAAQQPKFVLDITDSAGQLISSCYHGNFISGDNSGWNTAPEGVLWRDWQAVGVDLAPLHGQLIHVKLSNYDCAMYGHYGYAYFVLDSEVKNIRSTGCGDVSENTFYAPEGFAYRWYSAANPFQTLSTADSLHVTHPGRYYCQCTYNLSGENCGFTLSTDAYGRFPAAAFTAERLDTCGARYQFVNLSTVTYDSSHTDLSAEPCESQLWDFGDGTTSTAPTPIHTFPGGDFQVTLYAMLGGGQCVDSVSQWVHSNVAYDTIYDTICTNERLNFHGRTLADSGTYSYNEGCTGERLILSVRPVYENHYYDTAVLGQPYLFGTGQYDRPGIYRQPLLSVFGCDSVQTLHLSTIEERDSLACELYLPTTWWGVPFNSGGTDTLRLNSAAGTDSLVVLHLALRSQAARLQPQIESICARPAHFTITMPEGWQYTWRADRADSLLDGCRHASQLELSPSVPTIYYYEADYPDAPSCPIADSLRLDPPDSVRVRLLSEPDEVIGDYPGYRVTDTGTTALRHAWFVDDIPQGETSHLFFGLMPPAADSIRVTAVGYNGPCTDTAEVWIKQLKQAIYFPNVFTPEASSNNRFRGYGTNIRDYQLEIFTKWGDCIFRSTDISEAWDGTRNGRRCPAGAYVYLCRYTDSEGKSATLAGTVLLVR